MSLIHDSLRKLENNQSKDQSLDSNVNDFKTNNGFNARKLWALFVAVVGIVLIIYAYLMLEKYQKQNEMLLNDMKLIKSNNFTAGLKADSIKTQPEVQLKPKEKLIIQPPILMEEPVKLASYGSLQDKIKQQEVLLDIKEKQNSSADFLLENSKIKNQAKPVVTKKKKYKKKTNKKLTIKQTRQLVNNLQIQIDSKNTVEVESLLNKLSLSSGQNSIVYLRMKAYWSTTIKDDVTASSMYKKILFQKPNDKQANTNLALLEARNNKLDQAVNRLKALRIEYPTDKSIVTYLDRIESMYDQ